MLFVSTHAPAWGATGRQELHLPLLVVSIHAPAWGATICLANNDAVVKFQSTLPHGERLLKAPSLVQGWEFQSTLPHGERLSPSIFLIFN